MSRWPKCSAHPAAVALKESATIDASAPAAMSASMSSRLPSIAASCNAVVRFLALTSQPRVDKPTDHVYRFRKFARDANQVRCVCVRAATASLGVTGSPARQRPMICSTELTLARRAPAASSRDAMSG